MKLYYSPWACSLASHIALEEGGADYESERVDLKTKLTASGRAFAQISSKGYVPVLIFDNGEMLTENVAILDWLSTQFPQLAVEGPMGRTRALEALTYISTEVHRAFKPMWHAGGEAETAKASATVTRLLQHLADAMAGDYLFGARPGVADFYLFVMLLWATRFEVAIPSGLEEWKGRMAARPAVQRALRQEGLL